MEFMNLESQLRDIILKMIIIAWVGAVKALAAFVTPQNESI
jgi:hypothetical protein